jgi:hypothetical protein
MKNKSIVLLLVLTVMLPSCRPEPMPINSNFKIYNQSEHDVILDFYDKNAKKYDSILIENQLFYERNFSNIYCCNSCFLSMSDSVVFYFDDTLKRVHYLYDTLTPANNIYKSLYFDQNNADCVFEYLISNEDYLEALENK